MIGKKDTHCIFEQYRSVLKEQVDDRVKALLSAIAISDLDEEFKKGLNNLLSDPEVATKWKGGPVKSINDGDPNFANQMRAAQKTQNAAYPESEVKKFLGEDEEETEPPAEAPWWVPGEDAKERWLSTQRGYWRQAQKEKQGGNAT